MRELVRYATTTPPSDCDEKAGFRYPFVAHEVLKSGARFVLAYFFEPSDKDEADTTQASTTDGQQAAAEPYNKAALDGFAEAFLESDASDDAVLAGYFAAVVHSFLQHRRPQTAHYFFAGNARLVQLLVAKLHVASLGQLLASLLLLVSADEFEDDDGDKADAFAEERCAVVRSLLADAADASLERKAATVDLLKKLADNAWRSGFGVKVAADAIFADSAWLDAVAGKLATRGETSSLQQRIMRRLDLELLGVIVGLLVVNKPQSPMSLGMTADHQRLKKTLTAKTILAHEMEKENKWVEEFLIRLAKIIVQGLDQVLIK